MADSKDPSLPSPLNPAVLRGLGDRSYDKRKAAATEVSKVTKDLYEDKSKSSLIPLVISTLTKDFVESKNVNHRKGGLIGLAACAIGLSADLDRYLSVIVIPILRSFDDGEARVCYYACESLYNVAKMARGGILKHFNQIFDGLCKVNLL